MNKYRWGLQIYWQLWLPVERLDLLWSQTSQTSLLTQTWGQYNGSWPFLCLWRGEKGVGEGAWGVKINGMERNRRKHEEVSMLHINELRCRTIAPALHTKFEAVKRGRLHWGYQDHAATLYPWCALLQWVVYKMQMSSSSPPLKLLTSSCTRQCSHKQQIVVNGYHSVLTIIQAAKMGVEIAIQRTKKYTKKRQWDTLACDITYRLGMVPLYRVLSGYSAFAKDGLSWFV